MQRAPYLLLEYSRGRCGALQMILSPIFLTCHVLVFLERLFQSIDFDNYDLNPCEDNEQIIGHFNSNNNSKGIQNINYLAVEFRLLYPQGLNEQEDIEDSSESELFLLANRLTSYLNLSRA